MASEGRPDPSGSGSRLPAEREGQRLVTEQPISGPHEEEARRSEVLGAARSGGLNFAGAAFNQALRLAITLLIARFFGRADAGLYYQAFSFLALLGLVASSGFTVSLTRFVAVHRADDDLAALKGTVRLGLLYSTSVATVIGVALLAASSWLASGPFHDPGLAPLLKLVAFALPATVFSDTALSATQGYKTMRPYALINLFFEPTCRVVLTLVAFGLGTGLVGVMAALVVTNYASAVLSAGALRKLMGRTDEPARYNVRELFGFSAVTWFTTLASSGLLWADTILLGLFRSAAEVGVYQISTRLVLLATVFVQPVTTSYAPRVADLYRRRRFQHLADTYSLLTGWIFRLALPVFVVLMVFPRELLAIFGPSFKVGATVTVLLALGQMVNSATGPCGYMLIMSGRPALQMVNNIAALVMNVGLNLWLIPRYGIVGAAISWTAAIVIFNVVRVVQVWFIMRMLPLSRGIAKGIVAGGGACAVAVAVQTVVVGEAALLWGAVAAGASYLAGLALLRISPDDRLVLGVLLSRFRLRGA
jgi:O-antigen/teichoic acid export membrane protein